MKTEVSINDSQAQRLREAAEVAGISFNLAVQQAIDAGLQHLPKKPSRKPYRTKPHHFGTPMENPKAVLAILETADDLARYGGSK
jgi:hypothetical protein